MGDTIVILPTYNESENIVETIEKVLAAGDRYDVLVVDDESPDGTGDVVKKQFGGNGRVHLMSRRGPRGRGLAGKAGFIWAVQNGYERAVEMDADGSHNPVYLEKISEGLSEVDVAICSRLVAGGGETGRGTGRRFATLFANLYLRAILGLPVRDCTTGYRGFRRSVLEAVPWDEVVSVGPSIVQEVLYIAVRNGASIKEIPFMFEERHAGVSKLNAKLLLAGFMNAVKIRSRHS